MQLKDKLIYFLGDSITEGALLPDHSLQFSALVSAKTGAAVKNFSVSGTRIARQLSAGKRDRYGDYCFRASEMEGAPDIIAVFGGTNDYGHGDVPIGTPDDRTVYTFCGACHTLFSDLTARFPNTKIVVFTPLHRWNECDRRGDGSKTKDGGTLPEYVTALRDIAESYGLPVLDLFREAELVPSCNTAEDRFFFDGLHPNENGHAYLADRIIEFFRTL